MDKTSILTLGIGQNCRAVCTTGKPSWEWFSLRGKRREEGEREKREEKVEEEGKEGNLNSRSFQAKIIIIF